jgi:serine/threonine protein kinase/tetratricopeptide (TPR) repeat protein
VNPERWRRTQEVFLAAAVLPRAERASLLDTECGSDAALRARVERMLAADETSDSLLDHAPGSSMAPAAPDRVGRRVGPYRIVRELGRGGMGAVFLAERVDVGKRVALKLVRDGLARPDHVERFLLERRVLARLEHPNIAQLFDAGVADDDTPYFAMEYVDGRPLDRYCDEHRLDVDARVGLFEMACAAVAAAHAEGVVHRDLKPSNILVTKPGTLETGGQVKLLDFGIAKVLGEGPTGASRTQTDVRPMTPEYAAPEQRARGAVTPATDVYALGLLLYRLLSGHPAPPPPPPDGAIGEPDPPRPGSRQPLPSDRVTSPVTGSDPGEALTPEAIATARSTTPDALRAALRGDLDRITAKALAPHPADRYSSAVELLEDVRRYRAGLEVRARPARRSRRGLRARRRTAGVAVGVLVALFTVAGLRAWRSPPLAASFAGSGPATVAVLPFDYTGPGEHRYLGDGIVSLLSSAFDATDGLRAVEPRAVFGTLNAGTGEPPGARAVARRLGAPMYVVGEVVEIDDRLRISATLRDTTDRVLAQVPVEGQPEALFALLDQVAGRLLVAMLGRRQASLAQRAALSTGSLPALRAYLQGERHLRSGQYDTAVDAFERAVAEDPEFVLAHYRLSTTATWTARSLVRRRSAVLAAERAGQLGLVDSVRVVSWLRYLDGESNEALHGFRSIVRSRPDDIDAWFQLGETQYHWMPSLGEPPGAAREAFERVLRYEPENGGALIHLVRIAATAGDRRELDALAERLLRVDPDPARVLEVDALRAFTGDDPAARREVAEALATSDPVTLRNVTLALAAAGVDPTGTTMAARRLAEVATSEAQRLVGDVLAVQSLAGAGRLREAREELARGRTRTPQLASELRAALALAPLAEPSEAELAGARAELEDALAAANRPPAEGVRPEPPSPVPPCLVGLLDDRLGNDEGALLHAERLERWQEGGPAQLTFARDCSALIRAVLLGAGGQPADALRLLGDAQLRQGPLLPGVMQYPLAHGRWVRAELYRQLGADVEALRWYSSFPDPGAYDVAYLAASHLRRADIHARLGERAEAAREYRRFLALWRDADPRLRAPVARARAWLATEGAGSG